MSLGASAAVLALCLASAPVLAPAQGGRERPRERLTQVVEAYYERQLRQRMGLSDEQLQRVMPLVRRLQRDRREMRERRFRALQELHRALGSGTATEDQVAGMVQALRATEREDAHKVLRDMEELDAALTPVQQAKYRLLEAALERKVREARARGHRQRGRRMGGERPPLDDLPEP